MSTHEMKDYSISVHLTIRTNSRINALRKVIQDLWHLAFDNKDVPYILLTEEAVDSSKLRREALLKE